MPRLLLACVPLMLTCTASLADNCDAVSAQIDAKIRAAGVAAFTLATVDFNDSAPGKLVGTCGMGTKKILYTASARPAAAAAAAASAAAAAAAAASTVARPSRRVAKPTAARDIITECKDGSMSLGGECRN